MTFNVSMKEITIGFLLFGSLFFLLQLWMSERLKASLQKETGEFLERLRWEMRVREQAHEVAGYMAIARNLKGSDSPQRFEDANRMAWELAMWLPEDVYRAMGKALTMPNEEINPLSVVIDVRKVLLAEKSGNLTQYDVIQHAPGIGKAK